MAQSPESQRLLEHSWAEIFPKTPHIWNMLELVPVVVWLPFWFSPPIRWEFEDPGGLEASKDCQDNSSVDHGLSFPSRSAKATPLSCFGKETTLECVCTRGSQSLPAGASQMYSHFMAWQLCTVYRLQNVKIWPLTSVAGGKNWIKGRAAHLSPPSKFGSGASSSWPSSWPLKMEALFQFHLSIYIYLSSNILLMFGDIGMISHLLLQALDPTDTDSHDDIPARNCRLTTINHCDLPWISHGDQ